MPIYTYYCPRCKTKFEDTKPIEKRHTAKCPDCKRESVLTPSTYSFTFKGGV